MLDLLLIVAGAAVGLKLPDIDQAPVLPLRHRSAFTHGALLPLAALYAAQVWPQYTGPLYGLVCGMWLHLLADIRPRAWRGGALINWYPLAFTFGPLPSWLWIAGGLLAPVWWWFGDRWIPTIW